MAPTTSFRLLLWAIAACGLALPLHSAHAQLLEFTGAELRGRIDRPSQENVWIFGDTNGNGMLDDDEHFGTRIDIDDTFMDSPGRGYFTFATEPPYRFGYIDWIDATGGPFQPDGLADDLNYSGQFGPDGFDTEDPGREPDVLFFPNHRDFDDLVRLPSPYASISRGAFARFGGAHLMHVLRFEGGPDFSLTTAQETFEVGYGARFFTGPQDLNITGQGGTMGRMAVDTSIDNQALGPQVSACCNVRQGRWQARAEATAALTYMNIDGDQYVQMGEDLVPGQFNRGLYVNPVRSNNHLNNWDFAPTLEAGVLASYDLTPSSLIFLRGDAIQFGNIRSVEHAVVWRSPPPRSAWKFAAKKATTFC
jgi:hypothetical protein